MINNREAEQILEETGKEIRVREKIDNWLKAQTSLIAQRLEKVGIEEETTHNILRRLRLSFNEEIDEIRGREGIDELKRKILERLNESNEDTDEIKEMKKIAEGLVSEAAVSAVERNIDGSPTEEDKKLLGVLSLSKMGVAGVHNPLLKEIRVSLFADNLNRTLFHEITHLILSTNVPSGHENRAQRTLEKKHGPEKKTADLFLGFQVAINETLASLSEEYVAGESKEPFFGGYQQLVNPTLFKKVFEAIRDSFAGMSQGEFDQEMITIYNRFSKEYKPDMSHDELKVVVAEFMKSMREIKGRGNSV